MHLLRSLCSPKTDWRALRMQRNGPPYAARHTHGARIGRLTFGVAYPIAHVCPISMSSHISICRYVLPGLSVVPNDAEESVRVRFAAAIAGIASTAHRLLVAQQLQGQKPPKPGESAPPPVGGVVQSGSKCCR